MRYMEFFQRGIGNVAPVVASPSNSSSSSDDLSDDNQDTNSNNNYNKNVKRTRPLPASLFGTVTEDNNLIETIEADGGDGDDKQYNTKRGRFDGNVKHNDQKVQAMTDNYEYQSNIENYDTYSYDNNSNQHTSQHVVVDSIDDVFLHKRRSDNNSFYERPNVDEWTKMQQLCNDIEVEISTCKIVGSVGFRLAGYLRQFPSEKYIFILQLAAKYGNTSLCKQLINTITDERFITCRSHATPFFWAIMNSHINTAAYLNNTYVTEHEDFNRILLNCCRHSFLTDSVRYLLSSTLVSKSYCDRESGYSPYHIALMHGNDHIAILLIEASFQLSYTYNHDTDLTNNYSGMKDEYAFSLMQMKPKFDEADHCYSYEPISYPEFETITARSELLMQHINKHTLV